MRVTACSGANWEEYENPDHGRLGLQGERAGSVHSPRCGHEVPFISHRCHQTQLSGTPLLKVIFLLLKAFPFPPPKSVSFPPSNLTARFTFDRCYCF